MNYFLSTYLRFIHRIAIGKTKPGALITLATSSEPYEVDHNLWLSHDLTLQGLYCCFFFENVEDISLFGGGWGGEH